MTTSATVLAAGTTSSSDPRVMKHEKDGKLSIGVKLYRLGSGRSVVATAPNRHWLENMQMLSELGDGNISMIVSTTHEHGYDKKHGCSIVILPGTLDGKNGSNGDQVPHRKPVVPETMDIYQHGGHGHLGLELGFDDVVRLRNVLGEIIENAGKNNERAAAPAPAQEDPAGKN